MQQFSLGEQHGASEWTGKPGVEQWCGSLHLERSLVAVNYITRKARYFVKLQIKYKATPSPLGVLFAT